MNAGVQVEVHHHEVSTAGQNEIDMKFAPLVRMVDNVMIYKYFVKNIARRHGKAATFMPKPLFADNASGMHCHQSLWNEKKNLNGSAAQVPIVAFTATAMVVEQAAHLEARMDDYASKPIEAKELVQPIARAFSRVR